ncbi:MAG: heme biosynthesis HemY N-terminal domain-containing protein, partial [Pseudomonadales bacterium]
MRRLFIFVLIVLAITAASFSTLETGGGYVLIAVGDTTIEMAFIVAAALNVFAFIALYFLVSILRMVFSTRQGVLAWAKNHRRQRGLNRTTQGLIAFVEGRWDVARKTL